MKPRLRVTASGMCCAVGFSARAARAAIRARLNRFFESEFMDDKAEPVVVSRLPLGDFWGPRRMATLFEAAVADCLTQAPDFRPQTAALLLLVAEQGRPGYSPAWERACVTAYEKLTRAPLPVESRTLTLGRAGLVPALRHAQQLLMTGRLRHVLVVGVDSYLNAETIRHLLHKERLLTEEISDGFIPSEGAGAVLLERESPGQAGLHVLGVGTAEEKATFDNDEPMRALGLTSALREALAASGYKLNDLHFRMADMSGEPYFFREAAMADTRLLDHRKGRFPLLHLADCIGETGAAIGPLSLAYLADAMARGYVPGTRAVIHLANDGGTRAAAVVEHLSP
jgi:3-oxoacyl-[acyl-carrier-protein] synthase-1